ncbi:MAG: pentapeptide repeat-containing protein [Candidatus Celaenobacter polaris]|nr:pentapeptide repeat-containing protein [Candidatus Celaenobacter polaris]
MKEKIRLWNDWRLENASELPDLKGINLVGENLVGINFIGADLSGADLSRADLSTAELSGVVLAGATLMETKFIHATIYGGGLGRANLQNANLDGAALNSATLSNANLTGANIHGISRTGWKIKNIKCDYVYLDQDCKMREPDEGFFDPGEFEKLYQYSPKIKHVFIDEFTYIDILIMDKVVQEINDQNPTYKLTLDCFQARGKPRAEFLIKDIRDSEKVLAEIKDKYEAIKTEFTRKLQIANVKAETYRDALSMSLKEPSILIEHIELYDYKQIWFEFQSGTDNYGEKLIKELSIIREALKAKSRTIEQDQAVGKIADAEQAAKIGDGTGVIKHLKSAGKWVLDVSTNLGTNIATELIKKSMGL